MSKIFEEALADAKKLKAVAEENAQKAILESVTPQIKQFIEQTLLEQDETENEELSYEEASEEHDESVVLDESAIISLVEMLVVKQCKFVEMQTTDNLFNLEHMEVL